MSLNITSQNFKTEVLDFKGKILVDFWAEWCGPCKMLSPIIEEIETELSGKIKVGKVDVDKESQLASEYNVSAIPSVIIFENGKIKETIIGFRQKQDYLKAINK